MRPDLFCSLFYCRKHGGLRVLSDLRPFRLDDEVSALISVCKLWQVFSFKESRVSS